MISFIEQLKGKNILITGGLGFVGGNLTSKLLSCNIKPILLDFIPANIEIDARYLPFNLDKIEFFNADIRNQKEIIDIIKKVSPDYIVHLAALTKLQKDFETAFLSVEINLKGTLNLLRSNQTL